MLAITPLAGSLGAEVHGVDAATVLGSATVAQLRAALSEHLVLVLRGQRIDAGQFEAFGRSCFGELYVHPVFPGVPGHPAVLAVTNRGKALDPNSHWHSDATFVRTPPKATALYAQVNKRSMLYAVGKHDSLLVHAGSA